MQTRLLRTLTALTLTGSLALLAGCSGDDDEPTSADPTSSPSPTEADAPGDPVRDCTVSAEVTGAVEASWEGSARVVLPESDEQPAAIYTATFKKDSLTVYAAGGGDVATSAVVAVGGTVYVTQGDDGLDVDAKGKGASVDADASSVSDTVRLTAEIECGKAATGKG